MSHIILSFVLAVGFITCGIAVYTVLSKIFKYIFK